MSTRSNFPRTFNGYTNSSGGQPKAGPTSVLLIADSQSESRRIEDLLSDPALWRFDMEEYNPGLAAAGNLATSKIDVILLALEPGTLSSSRIQEWIQTTSTHTPIIVICGAGEEAAAENAVAAGAQDFLVLTKFDGELLTRVIRWSVERQGTAKQLAGSQARFNAIVENSSDAVVIFAADGKVIFGSPATCTILGYNLADFVGHDAAEFLTPEGAEYFRERLADSLRRPKEPIHVVAQIRHKDGSCRLCEGTMVNLLDEPGVEGIINFYRDITDELRNKALVDWLRLAVDQGPAAVIMTDSDGHIEYVNQKFTTDTGYTSDEAVGKKTSILSSGRTSPEQYAKLWATIKSGNPYRGEIENRRKNGEFYWSYVQISPVKDTTGAIAHFLGVQTDISAQKESGRALQESMERFQKLSDASFDAIAISQDGILREANHGFIAMFGYDTLEDVVGRPLTDFAAEESRAEVARRAKHDIEGGYEMVGLRKDGTRIWADVTARTHLIEGRPGRITALRDTTEHRKLENQFRQAQKMEAVGRLAGGVAHDFNNLLTVILSYTDMLIESVSPKDPRSEDLAEVRKASIAAASLTRQLLAFSRQQVIAPRLVNLNEVVAESEKMLRRLIGEDVELHTTFPQLPLRVMIDPGQLEQVIMNLVVNSRDAMPNGGKLTLETQDVVLDDAYARNHWPAHPGRFAMLAVSDTGIGMDEATRSRIFEPFFTTKELGRGTGLGLATVYGIVKQSNGFIWVYSEPGEGSSFKIYLPLVNQSEPDHNERVDARAPHTGSETILLVEDSPAVRTALQTILRRCGYTVLEAPTGALAVRVAEGTDTIDLLLTDVVMPGMSGRELSEQFAKLRPNTKVLFMSGYTDDAVVRHGVLTAGTPYLQKPFSAETLAGKVREVLDSRVKTG
jgi:two-component system cell cycle sensor histidine kinase/response regulator CckA